MARYCCRRRDGHENSDSGLNEAAPKVKVALTSRSNVPVRDSSGRGGVQFNYIRIIIYVRTNVFFCDIYYIILLRYDHIYIRTNEYEGNNNNLVDEYLILLNYLLLHHVNIM